MSDATPLDQLMPAGGSQQPAMSLPASTTYPQMITPGTASAIVSPPHPSQNGGQMHPYMIKNVLKNIMTYVSIFGAVFLVSLSQVQSLLLRYIPNSYAGSGVVSLTGAAVLGAVGVVLVYVIQTLLQPLI